MSRMNGKLGVLVAGCIFMCASGKAFANRFLQHWEKALVMLEETKTTQAKAIQIAEEASKGKAVSTHSVVLKNDYAIWVHCLKDGKCLIVPVEPKSGRAAESWVGVPADLSCATADEAVKLMNESKIDLLKALETAEKETKGKAFSSKSEAKDGVLTLSVGVGVNNKPVIVTIDGKTGKVTKTEESDYVTPRGP